LVYFSSLSKFIYLRRPLVFIMFVLVFLRGVSFLLKMEDFVSINNFYFDVFILCFVIIVVSLLFFINFVRYFLSLGVAIRKI